MRRIYEQIQTVEDMSLLNGVAFEEFLADVFRGSGYEVDTTPRSGDYGADLVMSKDGRRIVVQAKQYAGAVGFDAVKEVHFAKDFYKADEAWVVATHGFTPQATSAAESTGVRLVSGAELVRMTEEVAAQGARRYVGEDKQIELALGTESDSSLFTLSGETGEELLQYHGHERDVVIPSCLGVRFIGAYAFSDPGEYVKWPEGFVDPVCNWAGIQSVVVPEGVTMIGFATFRGCKSLRSVSLPSTLRHIGPSAFENCVSLRTINLPSGLEQIWSSAFKGCASLQQIDIPQGVRKIEWDAFAGCESLSVLSLPPSERIVEIQDDAFRETGIRSLTIRGNYRLGARCFERCFGLSSVSIESIQGEGKAALELDTPGGGVSRRAIGMTNLPESTFELCRMLKDVSLPDTLVSIGDGAFAKCVSLQSIDIPKCVTEIGTKAFYECSRLLSIRIPQGVEVIRSETFTRCWMLSDISMSEGLKSIEEEAFFACSRIRRISLPTSIEEVASQAFASCDALADVVMSPNVQTIRSRTFAHCTVLAHVTLPEGLESIENRAFWGCTQLRSIQLPASIELVASGAFDGCEALEEVLSSPGCNGTIYRSAFSGCPVMKRDDPVRNLPDSATIVNDACFPSIFDGPSHELRAMRFITRNYGLYSEPESSHLSIVDCGVEGLNSFTGGTEGAGFWIVLNDGCDRGFYSVRGVRIDSKEETKYESEGYLEPKPKERWYSSSDPSQSGCGAFMSRFSIYLHNCHLAPSQTVDGALAASLVDAYRGKVGPYVDEYKRIEGNESVRGRRFEERKLAVLDGLHGKIKAINSEFEIEAKKIDLDYKYYVRECSASLGSGLAPSEKAAQAKAPQRRAGSMVKAQKSGSLSSLASTGCGCLTTIVTIAFVLLFAFIWMLVLL